jgi:hypothetical protein
VVMAAVEGVGTVEVEVEAIVSGPPAGRVWFADGIRPLGLKGHILW